MNNSCRTTLERIFAETPGEAEKQALAEDIRAWIHENVSGHRLHPVDLIRWIPIDMIQANDYNPNRVATKELQLLHTSIEHDGYTQPVVTIFDRDAGKYIIVDGFHRYLIMRTSPGVAESTNGMLPIVTLKKSINDRMASTIRHNRARGKHMITGMSNMVFELLDNGWEDQDICNELGMEPEELVRLKHITGFSKLFSDADYSRAWESRRQIRIRMEYHREHPDDKDKYDKTILA